MDKNEIIGKWAREKVVEKIVEHFNTFAKDDLCQYVYTYLLTITPEELIKELAENNQYKYYIARIVRTQICSRTSDYVRTYKQCGCSVENEDENELKYVNKLEYIPEEEAHQIENEFYEYINTLTDYEKDIMYILMQAVQDRGEDIKIWCNRYGKTYDEYGKLMKALKYKTRVYFGKEPEEITKYEEGKRIGVFKDGKLLYTYNTVDECFADLIPKGYDRFGISYCLTGKRIKHKGCKFFWIW